MTIELLPEQGLQYPRLVDTFPHGLPDPATAKVGVIGLGYVGLPLVIGFARQSHAIGFDIGEEKVEELKCGIDHTDEVSAADLIEADATFTTDPKALAEADVLIVCVPTPINGRNQPDYGPLMAASATIGRHIKKGTVVVFESTVDPGTTEGRCLPAIEGVSNMKEGVDFFLGYSPERINPADPTRKLADIKKIVAGSTPEVTDFLAELYGRVVDAGLCKASCIKVAEAAKILENTQRDVNIALMNEMMVLFDKMGLRSTEVIAAAGSKWNFHNYRPGLVGGHCIAVDPYYLVDAGRRHGLGMDLVASARTVNEGTPVFLAEKLEELFERVGKNLQGQRVLVLGRSFKENCPDTRNSKAYRMMDALWARGANVSCFDPIAADDHFEGGRGSELIDCPLTGAPYDAVIVTLVHREFRENLDPETLIALAKRRAPLVDLRGMYDCTPIDDHFTYWRP